jgi:hypothetical protein
MSGCPAHLAAGVMVDRRDTPFRNAIWRFAMRGHVGAGAPRPKGRICLGYSPALYRHAGSAIITPRVRPHAKRPCAAHGARLSIPWSEFARPDPPSFTKRPTATIWCDPTAHPATGAAVVGLTFFAACAETATPEDVFPDSLDLRLLRPQMMV